MKQKPSSLTLVQWVRKLAVAFLACIVAMTTVLPAAHAAADKQGSSTSPLAYTFACSGDVCELRLKDAGSSLSPVATFGATTLLRVLRQQIAQIPDSLAVEITEDVALQLPLGAVSLLDADLAVELAPDRSVERISGRARVPISLMGFLDSKELVSVDVGLEFGDRLQAQLARTSSLVLDRDRQYFYFRLTPGSLSQAEETHDADGDQISIPSGHQFLVVHDPLNSLVYADGYMNFRMPSANDLSSLIAGSTFLNAGALLPFLLTKQSAGVHVSWLLAGDMSQSFMQFDGEYTLSEAVLSRIMSEETGSVRLAGSMRVDANGVLLRGATGAEAISKEVFDSGLAVEAFVPFTADFWDTRVVVGGHVALPVLAVRAEGKQQIDGTLFQSLWHDIMPGDSMAEGRPIYLVLKDRVNNGLVWAGRGVDAATSAVSNSYRWTASSVGSGGAVASRAATQTYSSVLDFATSQYGWVSIRTATAADSVKSTVHTQFIASKNFVTKGYSDVTGALADTVDTVIDTTHNGVLHAGEVVSTTTNTVVKGTQNMVGAASAAVSNTTSSTVDALDRGVGSARDTADAATSKAKELVTDLVDSATDLVGRSQDDQLN